MSDQRRTETTSFAALEQTARANGYWHNIKPWSDEMERLRRALLDIATMANWHPDGGTATYAINRATEVLK